MADVTHDYIDIETNRYQAHTRVYYILPIKNKGTLRCHNIKC